MHRNLATATQITWEKSPIPLLMLGITWLVAILKNFDTITSSTRDARIEGHLLRESIQRFIFSYFMFPVSIFLPDQSALQRQKFFTFRIRLNFQSSKTTNFLSKFGIIALSK
jgi:hypothetical protein